MITLRYFHSLQRKTKIKEKQKDHWFFETFAFNYKWFRFSISKKCGIFFQKFPRKSLEKKKYLSSNLLPQFTGFIRWEFGRSTRLEDLLLRQFAYSYCQSFHMCNGCYEK